MQNNRNHSHRAHVCGMFGWSRRPVCSLSGCLFLCRCVFCLCVWAAALFSLPVFSSVYIFYLHESACLLERDRGMMAEPDAFAGSVVKHRRAQRKGEGVVGGGGWVGNRPRLLTHYSTVRCLDRAPRPHLLHHHHPFPLIPFPDITILALSRNFAHALPWNSS